MNMASLQSLPNELLDSILSNLDFRSAINVSKTCRGFHERALPMAYHSIDLEWSNMPTWDGSVPEPPRTQSLLRMLLDKPEYAQLVKKLEFRTDRCVHYDDEGWVLVSILFEDATGEEIEAFLAENAIQRFLRPNQGQWDDETIDSAFFQAFIIGLCTKIESLSIPMGFVLHTDWLEVIMWQGMKVIESGLGDPWFKNLRRMCITYFDEGNIWAPEFFVLHNTFLLLFYLTNVETLELAAFVDMEENDFEMPLGEWLGEKPPEATNLTTLRLQRCWVSPVTLHLILQQTPNLKTFEYSFVTQPGEKAIQLPELGNALRRVRASLEDLTLGYDIYLDEVSDVYASDVAEGSACGSIGSLRDFPVLATLKTSLTILFGLEEIDLDYPLLLSKCLPASLQRLALTDDPFGQDRQRGYFDDKMVMQIFATYLLGFCDPYVEWQTAAYKMMYREVEEPLRVAATAQLKEFSYDSRALNSCFSLLEATTIWDDLERRYEQQGLKMKLVYHLEVGDPWASPDDSHLPEAEDALHVG